MTLQEAVRSFKNHDRQSEEAFQAIYRETYRSAMAVIERYCDISEDYEYLLQETYIQVYQWLDRLGEDINVLAWIKMIAGNTAIRHSMKQWPTVFSAMDGENGSVPDFEDKPGNFHLEEIADRKAVSKSIARILDSLPYDQRVSLWMVYGQQISIKEMAANLGISENTIKSRLYQGRQKLMARGDEFHKYGVDLGAIPLSGLISMAFQDTVYAAEIARTAAGTPGAAEAVMGHTAATGNAAGTPGAAEAVMGHTAVARTAAGNTARAETAMGNTAEGRFAGKASGKRTAARFSGKAKGAVIGVGAVLIGAVGITAAYFGYFRNADREAMEERLEAGNSQGNEGKTFMGEPQEELQKESPEEPQEKLAEEAAQGTADETVQGTTDEPGQGQETQKDSAQINRDLLSYARDLLEQDERFAKDETTFSVMDVNRDGIYKVQAHVPGASSAEEGSYLIYAKEDGSCEYTALLEDYFGYNPEKGQILALKFHMGTAVELFELHGDGLKEVDSFLFCDKESPEYERNPEENDAMGEKYLSYCKGMITPASVLAAAENIDLYLSGDGMETGEENGEGNQGLTKEPGEEPEMADPDPDSKYAAALTGEREKVDLTEEIAHIRQTYAYTNEHIGEYEKTTVNKNTYAWDYGYNSTYFYDGDVQVKQIVENEGIRAEVYGKNPALTADALPTQETWPELMAEFIFATVNGEEYRIYMKDGFVIRYIGPDHVNVDYEQPISLDELSLQESGKLFGGEAVAGIINTAFPGWWVVFEGEG